MRLDGADSKTNLQGKIVTGIAVKGNGGEARQVGLGQAIAVASVPPFARLRISAPLRQGVEVAVGRAGVSRTQFVVALRQAHTCPGGQWQGDLRYATMSTAAGVVAHGPGPTAGDGAASFGRVAGHGASREKTITAKRAKKRKAA